MTDDAGQDGDRALRESFEALWHAHYAYVLAFCLRRSRDRQAANDAAAETFLVAWRRAHEVPERPRPWLLGVALNVIANGDRGQRRREALTARLEHAAERSPDARLDEPSGEVLAAFGELRPADREVLRLVAWDGLSPREGAQVLGIPVARFSVRLHRAKQRLRKRLAEAPAEPDASSTHVRTETR